GLLLGLGGLGGLGLGLSLGGIGLGGGARGLRAVGTGLLDRLGDDLDDGHRGVVALAGADLRDAGVSTLTSLESRGNLGEQRVDHGLVGDRLQHHTTRGEVAALGLGDQLLGQGLHAAGLGLGGGDTAVLEELGGQVAQHEALVGGAT